MRINRSLVRKWDDEDPLKKYRQEFVFSDPELIYLDGNSLGRMPKSVEELSMKQIQHYWGDRLIRSWNEGWLELPEKIGASIAELIGAKAHEVIIADSTSINLFKLALGILRKQKDRKLIVTDHLNFPSDIYILDEAANVLDKGHRLKIVGEGDEVYGPVEALESALSEEVALLSLSHTTFKSGYTYPMKELNTKATSFGVDVLWDLSHSVGAVPIHVNDWDISYAVGCTYKYLNGGPGAPAFLYVREDMQEELINSISGWMGHKRMFEFGLDYEGAHGMRKFLTGTPAVLSTVMIDAGVSLMLDAGIEALREKSLRQSQMMIELWRSDLAPLGFRLVSPEEQESRGSHISLAHEYALAIDLALIHEKKVLPDFRAPDIIRLGIAPIYTTYEDIWEAMLRIRDCVKEGLYQKYLETQPKVT